MTNASYNGNGFNLAIYASLVGEVINPFRETGKLANHPRYKFRITIRNLILTPRPRAVSFPFYDSINHYEKDIRELPREDLMSAFIMILEDSSYADLSKEDICSEFGYDCFEQKKTVNRVYNTIRSTEKKLNSIGISREDIQSIVEDPAMEEYR